MLSGALHKIALFKYVFAVHVTQALCVRACVSV